MVFKPVPFVPFHNLHSRNVQECIKNNEKHSRAATFMPFSAEQRGTAFCPIYVPLWDKTLFQGRELSKPARLCRHREQTLHRLPTDANARSDLWVFHTCFHPIGLFSASVEVNASTSAQDDA